MNQGNSIRIHKRVWHRVAPLIVLFLATAVPQVAQAATYSWNTTSGTWDTSTANWTGAGSTWVDGNDAVFTNTATLSTITLNGTLSATSLQFGSAANDNANYTLTSGTLNVTGQLDVQGQGGNVNNWTTYPSGFPTVTINSDVNVTGATKLSAAILNITGGNYTTDSIQNYVNAGSVYSYGVLTISGGTVTAINGISSPGLYTMQNFNGGTLYTPSIAGSYADHWTVGAFRTTFNGTVVKATSNNTTFVTSTDTQMSYISNGGAIFDSNDHNIGIGLALVNTSGQTGSLTKQGAGVLTLSGANTYTGTTTISDGTLLYNGTLTGAGGAVNVNSGGTLGGTGTVARAVTVAGGKLAPGNSIGTLNIGTLTIGSGGTGTFAVELGINGGLPTSDRANVTGTVTLTNGANLQLTLSGSPPAIGDKFFILVNDLADSVNGEFTQLNGSATTLSDGSAFTWNSQDWQISYHGNFEGGQTFTGGNDIVIVAIPEPSTLVLVGFGLLGAVVLGRRHRRGGGCGQEWRL